MPPFVIRSREHGDGSEYDSSVASIKIPDHYVKRLWREPGPLFALNGPPGTIITFTNKDSLDRTVTYCATSQGNVLVIKEGGHAASGPDVARVDWSSSGKSLSMSKSRVSFGTKSMAVKDFLKTSIFNNNRTFIGPDNVEYYWKSDPTGDNLPVFPDGCMYTLFAKDSKHPIATTERLAERDGHSTEDTYPLYIAERGVKIQSWIVATLVMLEVITEFSSKSSSSSFFS